MVAGIVTDVCQCIPTSLIRDDSQLRRLAAGVKLVSLVPILCDLERKGKRHSWFSAASAGAHIHSALRSPARRACWILLKSALLSSP